MQERKEEKPVMFRQLFLTGLLTTMLTLPAFADVSSVKIPAIAASESVVMCDSDTLTTAENGATVVFKAVWKSKIYSCGPGYYLNKENAACARCLNGYYCEGFSDFPFDGTNHGLHECPEGYINSGEAATAESNCFKVVDVACADKNPYVYGKGTAVYRNSVTQCKKYAGNETCDLIDEHACDIVSLNCEQGFVAKTVEGTLRCVLETKVHCDAGEYLPAGEQVPTKCPENNYCPGGDYDFDLMQSSGIFECPEGLKAPEGAKLPEDCGHILHIDRDKLYLHSDKSTHPSLAVRIDNQDWYANTTPVSEGKKPISTEPNSRTMHIKVKGKEYTVHGRYVETVQD